MSDCVYTAWSQAVKDLGVQPREGSRQFFELAKSLVGEPNGLWGGATPVVVGLLCHMNNLTLSVTCHPWFNRTYYRAAAESQWQRYMRPDHGSDRPFQLQSGVDMGLLGWYHNHISLIPRCARIMTYRVPWGTGRAQTLDPNPGNRQLGSRMGLTHLLTGAVSSSAGTTTNLKGAKI